MLFIENDGPAIVKTNYWDTDLAQQGYVYLSINAGTFRLLLPRRGIAIEDIKSGQEVIVTRGPWPETGRPEALELLFEDFSDNPFALHIVPEQIDFMPRDDDQDQPGESPRWKFAVYMENKLAYKAPARYRRAKQLPYLKSWQA